MSNILGTGTITVYDLNDAILSSAPPTNPEPGNLWLDSSGSKNILKQWNGTRWVNAEIDVSELDKDLSETVKSIQSRIGTMADDGLLDIKERRELAQEIGQIIGEMPSTETTNKYPSALPTVHALDANGAGSFATYRERARLVGISTNETVYSNLGKRYIELVGYLEGMTPRPWDITDINKKRVTDVKEPSKLREVFLNYYLAELELVTLTQELAEEKVLEESNSYTDTSTDRSATAIDFTEDIGYNYPNNLGTFTNFSVEALVYWNGSEVTSTIYYSSGFTISVISTGYVSFLLSNGTQHLSTKSIPINTWVRISVTKDRTTLRIYIDGERVLESSAVYTSLILDTRATIGSGNSGINPFQGYISDFRIWDRGLSEEEITHNLSKQLIGNESGLLANYRMNGGNLIYDSSSNEAHIELTSNTRWVDSSSSLKEFHTRISQEIDERVEERAEELTKTYDADIANLGDRIELSVSELSTDVEGRLVDLESSILTQTSDTFDFRFNQLSDSVNTNTENLSEVRSYFTFRDDGTFTIGSESSPYKMVLSKDRLSFLDGINEVAYISNSTMQITRGIFTEDLTVGVHKLTSINNSFTALQWVPRR